MARFLKKRVSQGKTCRGNAGPLQGVEIQRERPPKRVFAPGVGVLIALEMDRGGDDPSAVPDWTGDENLEAMESMLPGDYSRAGQCVIHETHLGMTDRTLCYCIGLSPLSGGSEADLDTLA